MIQDGTRARTRSIARSAGLTLGGAALSAGLAAAEFSAEAIDRGPQGVMSRGMMYVSGERLRSETSRNGKEVVIIADRSVGQRWMLYPADHAYVELRAGSGQPNPEDPCAGVDGVSCTRVGDETVFGRPVTQWEVTYRHGGELVRSYHWIDTERGIPLKQHYQDGTRSEWRRVGLDRIEGRDVEKWEVLSEREGRPPSRSFLWLDPELQISVREEMPGGFVREIRNIRIGEQPVELFQLPPEFRPVTQRVPRTLRAED